jgi:hypothetical protein
VLDDELEPTASEFVDFAYYGEVISAGLERPPSDVEEPRRWTLTDDTTRTLSDKRTQSYDEYLHIGCYAFFESDANAAVSEGLDALSNGPPLSTEQVAAVALIRAGHRTTHRWRRPPVLDGASSASPRAGKRVRMRTASSPNMLTSVSVVHALLRSPGHWMPYAKLSWTARLTSAYTPPARPMHARRSLQTSHRARTPKHGKQPSTYARRRQRQQQQPRAHTPSRSHATPRDHHQRNDGVARRADSYSPSSPFMRHRVRRRLRECERLCASGQSPKLDPPRCPRQVQTRHTPTAIQPRHLYAGRYTSSTRVYELGTPAFPGLRCMGTLTQP